MKKMLSILFVLSLMIGTKVNAQGWTFQGIFPSDTLKTNSGTQFVVVDADGKIWMGAYRGVSDSMFVPDSGKYFQVNPLYVFNSDGTPDDTLHSLTIDGKLYPFFRSASAYGLTMDADGNILYCASSTLYRINYKTHEGMNRVAPGISSLCCPAVDAAGNIYLAPVLPGYPLKIYDKDFNFVANAIDTVNEYGRWMTVSKDGNTLYVPRFTALKLSIYHRASEFDPYELQDTVLAGAVIESGTWDPVDGNLWMSVGSFGNPPAGQFAGQEGTWYSFNVNDWSIKDSIKWNFIAPQDANEKPRGIAFSNDGTDAYVCVFGTGDIATVEKFNNPSHVTSVKQIDNVIVKDFNLSQNYPNPFNPTTQIKFSVAEPGLVILRVYDVLGQEVATLVNENLVNGNYSASFDASKLASGTYIYQLTANGVRISKKMMLLK